MSRSPATRPDPGVPEALPRTLAFLGTRLGPDRLDRLWIFPPLTVGRREKGLVVASLFAEHGARLLHTVSYSAERAGLSLIVEPSVRLEGLAPSDRLPRVIRGVVDRAERQLGEPREVTIDGDSARFDELLAEFDASLFEEVSA